MTDKYVYFSKDLTALDEYNLINEKQKIEKVTMKPLYGGFLIKKSTLFEPYELKIQKYTNEKYFFVVISMISSAPFYNLLRNMENKKKRILSFGNSLIEFINKNTIEDSFIGLYYEKIYHSICKKLHYELLECYFFDEVEWKTSIQSIKKPVFEEYSPIVEIFHIKTKYSQKDTIKIEYNDYIPVKDDIKKSIESFMTGKTLEKIVYTLVFNVETNQKISIVNFIDFYDKKYQLNAYINKEMVFYRIGDKWFKGCNLKVEEVDELPDFDYISMAFYTLIDQ